MEIKKQYIISQDGLFGKEIILTPKYLGRLFGPELEYFTVQKKNGLLIPVDITSKFEKSKYFMEPSKNQKETDLKIWMKPELTGEQIELNSSPENSISSLETNLNKILNEVLNIASDNDVSLLPAALYPLNHQFSIFPYERYHSLIKIIGPHMKKNAPRVTSDQVNVGGINEEDSFKVFNFLRQVLPFYVGFSVASPYVNEEKGEDLSERIRIYNNTLQRFPELSGMPPQINSMKEYVSELEQAPIIQHPNIYYKFIRPMPQRGVAAEIRVIDKQPTIKEHLSFIALTKGLLNNSSEFVPQQFMVRDFYRAVKEGIFDKNKFKHVLDVAEKGLQKEEKHYLKPLKRRLEHGTVAEKLISIVEEGATISEAYSTLCDATESGKSYI